MKNTAQVDVLESMALGRALAAHSHELKNVLAIVGEAAGLAEDILALQRMRNPESAMPEDMAARVDKALGSITAQVERGHKLTSDLNMLAHLPDRRLEPTFSDVDLSLLAGLACRMLERNARRSHVQLSPPAAVGATAPADAQGCLAACLVLLEWIYKSRQPGEEVAVAAVDGAPAIEIPDAPDLDGLPEDVRRLTESAGMQLETDNDRLRVTLMGV
jgi:signal transduction histidine kinase